jgi:uncharacterized protein Veg
LLANVTRVSYNFVEGSFFSGGRMENVELTGVHGIARIKATLHERKGDKLKFKTNLGRCRVHEAEGYVKEVYPNIFIVAVFDGYGERCVSYTYSDVLTKIVEIYDCETGDCLFPWIN